MLPDGAGSCFSVNIYFCPFLVSLDLGAPLPSSQKSRLPRGPVAGGAGLCLLVSRPGTPCGPSAVATACGTAVLGREAQLRGGSGGTSLRPKQVPAKKKSQERKETEEGGLAPS